MKILIDCIEADKPTRNNRIYSKESLEKMVELFNEKAKNKTCYVTNEISPNTSLDSIMGLVTNCELQKGRMVIEVGPCNGDMFEKLIESKHFEVTPNVIGEIHNGVVEVEQVVAFCIVPKQ
jgi:hypothetical protein